MPVGKTVKLNRASTRRQVRDLETQRTREPKVPIPSSYAPHVSALEGIARGRLIEHATTLLVSSIKALKQKHWEGERTRFDDVTLAREKSKERLLEDLGRLVGKERDKKAALREVIRLAYQQSGTNRNYFQSRLVSKSA